MSKDLVNPDGSPWVPEFEGQRPPFQPGNTLHLTHGAFSPRLFDPIAREFIDEVASDPSTSYLAAPRFATALMSWATACARVQLLEAYVDKIGMEVAADGRRGTKPVLELLRQWMVKRDNQAARLGLDPLSAARLGKDIAQGRQADAAAVLTQMRTDAESNGR